MRTKNFIILIFCLFLCFCNRNKAITDDSEGKELRQDTIVGSQIIKGDKYSADKIIAYFVKTGKDTSYVCAFISKNMKGKHIEICFDYHPNKNKFVSYQKRIQYLRRIVSQSASKDFDLSRLHSLYFDLLHTGGLAIDITLAYQRKYDLNNPRFSLLEKIIFESRLKADLEGIFKQYSLTAGSMEVGDECDINLCEKEDVYKLNEMEADADNVPKYILNVPVVVFFETK